MTDNVAVCKFCGQAFYTPSDEEMTQQELERYALMHCKCADAQDYRLKQEHIRKAKEQLAEVFSYDLLNLPSNEGEEIRHGDIRKKLEGFLEYIEGFEVLNLAISVSGFGKITLSACADGSIKIKRVVSNSIERKV